MRLRLLCILLPVCLCPVLLVAQPPALYTQLEKLYHSGDYEGCIALEKPLSAFVENRRDTLATNSCFQLGDAHLQLGNYASAILWWERERAVLKALKMDAAYSTSLSNLAAVYFQSGNYIQATKVAEELLDRDSKRYAADDLEFIEYTIFTVAEIYWKTDRIKEAEQLLSSYLRKQKKGTIASAYLLSKLGDLYTYKGEYSRASARLEDALIIFQRDLNQYSSPYVNTMVNLGILAMEQGKLPEAEQIFEDALRMLDKNDASYVPLVNNRANVFHRLGQYDKAIELFSEVEASDSITLGTTHPDFGLTLSNLAMVFNDKGDYAKAEKLMMRSLAISRANNDTQSSDYASKLNNLAKVYSLSGQPQKATELYEQALRIFEKTLGEKNPEYATTVFNLGVAYWKADKPTLALPYIRQSATIRAAILGKKHPKYAESVQKLAEFQWFQNKKKEARQTYGEVFDNYYFQIESIFPALTEEEKAKFYFNQIQPSFEKYNSFAQAAVNDEPGVMGDLYNQQLNTKAVIMLATEKVREAIYQSHDALLIQKFDEWRAIKEQIARAFSQNQSPNQTDSLILVANTIEKELSRASATFAAQFIKKKYNWQQIQSVLKPGEAAVEVIRYRSYNPEKGGHFSSDVNYAFLIVTSATTQQPHWIEQRNVKYIEEKYLNFYKNCILFGQPDNHSIKNYFQKLDEYCKANNIKRLYLSPDGVYHQINLNTLLNPATGRYVLDDYEIVHVTTTRELLEQKQKLAADQHAVLIGYPVFNMDKKDIHVPATEVKRSLSRGSGVSRGLRGGLQRFVDPSFGISILPGTNVELQRISALMKGSANPEVYRETAASEDATKRVLHPTILHIATHGYFLEDEVRQDEGTGFITNPLLKSGLILAGAENFIRTGTPVDTAGNDGVLTAYEAMNMNLEGTQLVVLSACETGLGVVKNGEGVYGLQRAFKLSGAKSIVMSLWNVDDEATQDLMILFYTDVLKTGDAQASLLTAQRKLKNKYPLPSHWGAFVLTGI